MKRLLSTLCLALAAATVLVPVAEAKRLGGGGTSGMKRTVPPRSAPDSVPAQNRPGQPPANQAAPTAPAAAAAAAAPKRSWMGPLAGLAAGLGIAALMSHLGLGAAMGNFLTVLLLAAVAFFAIRFLLRRFGPKATQGNLQFAGAGAAAGPATGRPADLATARVGNEASWQPATGTGGTALSAAAVPLTAAPQGTVPADFDTVGFERAAKLIFIRLQAANDASDLNDLRAFTTPEMFAAVKLDLQDRGPSGQQTDVVQLQAQVIDVAEEAAQQVVSVRFHGLIREELNGPANPFDEVWHLVKPKDGSREWAIAGIAQYA